MVLMAHPFHHYNSGSRRDVINNTMVYFFHRLDIIDNTMVYFFINRYRNP